jgi:hypothetical protein
LKEVGERWQSQSTPLCIRKNDPMHSSQVLLAVTVSSEKRAAAENLEWIHIHSHVQKCRKTIRTA